MKLITQAGICPIIPIAFNRIDRCLKEFVDCQRKFLSTRNNKQLTKFNDNSRENKLFHIITTYYPTLNQVRIDSYCI